MGTSVSPWSVAHVAEKDGDSSVYGRGRPTNHISPSRHVSDSRPITSVPHSTSVTSNQSRQSLLPRQALVYGMLGDICTDLEDLAAAGEYYDKCIAMD
jgi:hypothetical protein